MIILIFEIELSKCEYENIIVDVHDSESIVVGLTGDFMMVLI